MDTGINTRASKKRKMVAIRHDAALKLQTFFRRWRAQKLYHVPQLSIEQSTEFETNVMGNDPDFPRLHRHQVHNERIAVIGTSGLRSIHIACTLSDLTILPKLIIIDNSSNVIAFWRSLRQFVTNYDDGEALFFDHLAGHIETIENHCDENGSSDVHLGLRALISMFGFDVVIALIKQTTILLQDWENPIVLAKLKNILQHHGINKTYIYPSNIVAYMEDTATRDQLLINIQEFNPTLALHTNLDLDTLMPSKAYVFRTHQKEYVEQILFPTNSR